MRLDKLLKLTYEKKSCSINLLKLIETEIILSCIEPDNFKKVAKDSINTETKSHATWNCF